MSTTRFHKQSDPRWATLKLGRSKVSIGRSGCLLTVYAEISRMLELDVNQEPTPITLNKVAIAQNCFIGAGLVQSKLAHALGLDLGDLVTGDDAIRKELTTVRTSDTVYVVHVDHGGSAAGDHFVTGFLVAVDEKDASRNHMLCADPATGGVVTLSLSSLTGPALWGNKTYRIRSIRVVTKSQVSL